MANSPISEWLTNLADKIERNRASSVDSVSQYSYLDREVPKIPLIGGLIYIWQSYTLAKNVKEKIRKEQMLAESVSNVVRDMQLRKSRILDQLDEIYADGISRKITIDQENETILTDLCRDYNGLTAVRTGEHKYTIIVNREDSLL